VKATVSLNVPPLEARRSLPPARRFVFGAWMGILSLLLAVLFVGVTAVPGTTLAAACSVLVPATTAWQASQPGNTGHSEGGRLP
jgi:hypothetical protein